MICPLYLSPAHKSSCSLSPLYALTLSSHLLRLLSRGIKQMQNETKEQLIIQALSLTNQNPNPSIPNLSPHDQSSSTRGLDQLSPLLDYTYTSNNLHKFVPNYNYNSSKMYNNTAQLSHDCIIRFNNVNSNSDVTSSAVLKEEEQQRVERLGVQERRARRLMSNRESARRSRMRKRRQLEELQDQVLHLLAANHHLSEKLNQVLECNYQLLQENARLKQDEANFFLNEDFHDWLHHSGQRFSGRPC